MNWQTNGFDDWETLSRGAAEEMAKLAAAVSARGRFDWVLSGGHTPRRMYEILSTDYREKIDWNRTHLFWSDERYVPPDDPLSNFRMAQQALIVPLAIPEANVHPMPTYFEDPGDAARAYEKVLRAHWGAEDPAFDLCMLGIGLEGHTASLFPGSPALEEKQRWVVPVRVAATPPLRLTFTFPALDASREVFFLVSGAEKREIVRKLLALPPGEASCYPAAQVRPRGRTVLFLDRPAQP